MIVHNQTAVPVPAIQDVGCDRIANHLLNCVTHRPHTEFRMKSLPHEQGQDRCRDIKFMASIAEEADFTRQEFLGDFKLVDRS